MEVHKDKCSAYGDCALNISVNSFAVPDFHYKDNVVGTVDIHYCTIVAYAHFIAGLFNEFYQMVFGADLKALECN